MGPNSSSRTIPTNASTPCGICAAMKATPPSFSTAEIASASFLIFRITPPEALLCAGPSDLTTTGKPRAAATGPA